jgi:hypothetical protein
MRFVTAVALALVMLWVPVDGVAQGVGSGSVGDWLLGTSVDPFTDEKSTRITLSHVDETQDGFRLINIECGNNGLQFVFRTEALPSDVGPTYPLTYRLGDAPAKDVLAEVGANVPATSPGFANGAYDWLNEPSQTEMNLRALIKYREEGIARGDFPRDFQDQQNQAWLARKDSIRSSNAEDVEQNFALLYYSPQPSEALALLSSPRVAFRIGTYVYTRRNLAGTNEAVRHLHCVQ